MAYSINKSSGSTLPPFIIHRAYVPLCQKNLCAAALIPFFQYLEKQNEPLSYGALLAKSIDYCAVIFSQTCAELGLKKLITLDILTPPSAANQYRLSMNMIAVTPSSVAGDKHD